MKFAVLKFPGSNCDRDMYNAALKSGVEAEYVDYRNTSLEGFDGVLIPGGFSLVTIYVQVRWQVLHLSLKK